MENLAEAQAAIVAARSNLVDSVRRARTRGRTWADIGKELGMSKQAAFKRFGEPVDPRTGSPLATRSIDTVLSSTERVFKLIAAGDYEALTALMNPATVEELPASQVGDTWRHVLSEVGELEQFTGTHAELPGGESTLSHDDEVAGIIVGTTVLECEAGEVQGRVAFDEQSLIVGILLVPLGHTPLLF